MKAVSGICPVVADDRIELSDFQLMRLASRLCSISAKYPRENISGVKQNAYSIALISKLVGEVT